MKGLLHGSILVLITFLTLIFLSPSAFAPVCGDGSGATCTVTCYIDIIVFAANSTTSTPLAYSNISGSCSDTTTFTVPFSQTLNDTFLCGYYYVYGWENDYGASAWLYLFAVTGNCDSLNLTVKNQTGAAIANANVVIYEAGNTTKLPRWNTRTNSNGQVFFNLQNTRIYDVEINTTSYQQSIWYKSVRVPNSIDVSGNRKWVPETNLAASKIFTAGHIVPVEIHIFAPYAQYEVANVSIEDWVEGAFRIASNILTEKFTSAGRSICDVVPDNSTYYYIDKVDCSFLDYLNVTAKEWIRITYRIRLPGPETYTAIGEIKIYTLPTAYLRYDIVT